MKDLDKFLGQVAKAILNRSDENPFLPVVALDRGDMTAHFKGPVPFMDKGGNVIGEVVKVWFNGEFTWGQAKLNEAGEKIFKELEKPLSCNLGIG